MRLKGLLFTSCLAAMLGVGAFAGLSSFKSAEPAQKAEAATTSQDIPFVVRCYNDLGSGFYNTSGWSVGLYCTGGSGFTARTVKLDAVNDYVGVGILPAGTTKFKVIRTSNSLPMDGEASGDKWGEWDYNSSYNTVTLKSWPNNGGNQSYDAQLTALPKGKSVFVDVSAVSGSWYADNANTYLYTFLNNSEWHMTAGSEHRLMTRVTNSNYFYYTTTSAMVLDGVIVSRGNSNNKWWNQTTDIKAEWGFNPLYTTVVESGTDGSGHYNWNHTPGKAETGLVYGKYFLNNVTCSGSGSINPGSSWSAVSSMYSSLTLDVQGEVWNKAGNESGTDLEKAMFRYDYIVFYKKYSGYEDFIGRASSSGNPYKSGALIIEGISGGSDATAFTTAFASIAAVATVAAVGGFIFIRKKKII